MSVIRESVCREDRGGCGCVIFWAVTESSGVPVPVDWDGDAAADFMVIHNDLVPPIGGDARVPVLVHRSKFDPARDRLMRRGPRHNHFATCPNRDGFGSRGGSREVACAEPKCRRGARLVAAAGSNQVYRCGGGHETLVLPDGRAVVVSPRRAPDATAHQADAFGGEA